MAEDFNLYQDISTRTGGDIYIGVVGPVRTGKSTFIKNFMEMLIIPNIEDENERIRTVDELPQSSNGKTIMTTEPKFIPKEAVEVALEDAGVRFRAKMIDCVGYMVPGAIGHMENNENRMVKTPWFEEESPFVQAAEIGTRKVIAEHSTIGIVVTTDGSVTELNREEYQGAEQRVIAELKELGKPFVVVLNSARPYGEECRNLAEALSKEHGVPVLPVNCKQLRRDDIAQIMRTLLEEFPAKEVRFFLPKWMESLQMDHPLKQEMIQAIRSGMDKVAKLRDIPAYVAGLSDNPRVKKIHMDDVDMAQGEATVEVQMDDHLFYDILTEMTGLPIQSERQLISTISSLAEAKKEYEKVDYAFKEAMNRGYGIVNPLMDALTLEDPMIVRQGSKYGVKIKAKAPSVHLIRTDVETEINPFVGTQQQSEDFVNYLNQEMKEEPSKVWDSEIFGKSLYELVNEGLNNKLVKMPEDAQLKLQETLEKVINEGRGGLICIIL